MNTCQGRQSMKSIRVLGTLLLLTVLGAPSAFAQDVSSTSTALQTAPVSVLSLPVGQSLLMRYPDAKRVSAGDGAVVDVKVFDDTHETLVLGKHEGLTDLRLWGRDGSSTAYLVKVLGIPTMDPQPAPALQPRATILIKAKLIEVKKSALRDIGI